MQDSTWVRVYGSKGFYCDSTVSAGGAYTRNAAGVGYLDGNYGSAETGSTTGAIYTIGGGYSPTSTSLSSMYGIGYANNFSGGLSGSNWGMYVASYGVVRIYLDSDNGIGTATGSWRAPIFYDSNDTGYYVDPNGNTNLKLILPRTVSQSAVTNTSTAASTGYKYYDLVDCYNISASTFTLTPDSVGAYNGQKVLIRVQATATVTIAVGSGGTYPWNQVSTVPTAMAAGQKLYVGAIYNSVTGYWDIVSAKVG
jgi:hypothetical protein